MPARLLDLTCGPRDSRPTPGWPSKPGSRHAVASQTAPATADAEPGGAPRWGQASAPLQPRWLPRTQLQGQGRVRAVRIRRQCLRV